MRRAAVHEARAGAFLLVRRSEFRLRRRERRVNSFLKHGGGSGLEVCVQKTRVLAAGLLIQPRSSTPTLAFGSPLNLLCCFIIYLFA